MSVKIKGTKSMLEDMKRQYSEQKMLEVQDEALRKGANYFVSVLKDEFQVFRDKGLSIEEISQTPPHYVHGDIRMIKIYWNGPASRYSIIHLNEYGSVRNPNPRGMGAIARTMYITEQPYREIIKEVLEEGM